MLKSEKKEYVFSKLDELLKPQGYKLYKTGLDPRYNLIEKDKTISFFFNFKDMGQITFSKIEIYLKVIEDIMMEIKPYGRTDYKKYFPITIIDNFTIMPDNYFFGIGYDIENKKDLECFTDWIINYLETSGKEFIETYSYLPNILKKMDELQSEEKYWNELLAGGPEFLLRGLIISKLCNDKNYENKLVYVKELYISMADEYLPYLEKLKEHLKTVEPIYNL